LSWVGVEKRLALVVVVLVALVLCLAFNADSAGPEADSVEPKDPAGAEADASAQLHSRGARAAPLTPQPLATTGGEAAEPALVNVLVRDRFGEPSAGALARLCPLRVGRAPGTACGSTLEFRADGSGRCIVELPADWSGRGQLSAESADGSEVTRTLKTVAGGDSVNLRMSLAGTIRGEVTGLEPGESSHAHVLAYSSNWPEAPQSRRVAIGPDGTFLLTGAPGRINLVAVAKGRVPSGFWKGEPAPGVETTVSLALGGTAEQADLRVVVGAASVPVAGVPILYRTGSSQAWMGGTANGDGVITCTGLEPRMVLHVHIPAWRRGSGSAWLTVASDFELAASEWQQAGATLRLRGTVQPTLVLSSSDGRPASGMRLSLRQIDSPSGGQRGAFRRTGTSNDAGEWAVAQNGPVPTGRYELHQDGGGLLWSGVLSGREPVRVRIRTAGLVPIRVKFVDRDGNPARSRFVSAAIVPEGIGAEAAFMRMTPRGSRHFRESSQTTFFLSEEQAAGSMIRVREFRTGYRDFPLPVGESPLVVSPSEESGSLTVTCHDHLGERLGAAFIRLRGLSSNGRRAHYWVRADDHGEAVVHGMVPGEYSWECKAETAPGPPLKSQETFQVRAGSRGVVLIRWPATR
jgi:hypothetical protein